MIFEYQQYEQLGNILDSNHLLSSRSGGLKVAIKINLPCLPQEKRPRSDAAMLLSLAKTLTDRGCQVTLIECSRGQLTQHLKAIGLGEALKDGLIQAEDMDQHQASAYRAADGETHYLPDILGQYDLRIGLPVIFKDKHSLYSGCVKLFAGIIPHRYYQEGPYNERLPRPTIHHDIRRSVANIYRLVQQHHPFHYFISGGPCYLEHKQLTQLPCCTLSDNGIELDKHLCQSMEIPNPHYLEDLLI